MFKDLIEKPYKTIKALLTSHIVIECDRIPYHFHNVPWEKIINWIRIETSILRKPEQPWGWPTHLQIEPANICNLRCSLCPVTDGMNRPAGRMDFQIFKKLIDEIGDYIFIILFWDWGEPFVNPAIYKMINHAKHKGIKTISSTNGHIFAQINHADKVIQSGLDTLIIAMDGISQETYKRYRQGGKLKLVLQGIQTLVARKRILKSQTPMLNLRFIVMKHNEHEISQLKELARSLGVDALTLKTLNICSNDTYGEKKSNREVREETFLPREDHYKRFKYAPDGKSLKRLRKNPCKNLWNSSTIHWDGTVCPCTYDYNEKYVLGDLKINRFKDIWFSAPYQSMRRRFRANDKQFSFCYECSYAYKGGSCNNETIADAFFNLTALEQKTS